MPGFNPDLIIFSPLDVDLTRSPLRATLEVETYVLGAFNPGFTRLPNGNLLLMVRIAEALRTAVTENHVHSIRWVPGEGAQLDAFPLSAADVTDPRSFSLLGYPNRVLALTSLSWLLPVELSPDGEKIVEVHYGKAIVPERSYQEYGIEDARISRIDGRYYMTACAVSAERHGTVLYTSDNGLDYRLEGLILDHQNKDMLLFEGKPRGQFHALTRPLGEVYFAYPPGSPYQPGPAIQHASSPDALHWKPAETALIRPAHGGSNGKVGGGTPPILTDAGWLLLYHGVEPTTLAGIYRTFWALLDKDDPSRLLRLENTTPLLEANPQLSAPFEKLMYLPHVVFTTGMVDAGDDYLVASGEADLLCRMTRIPKAHFGDEM